MSSSVRPFVIAVAMVTIAILLLSGLPGKSVGEEVQNAVVESSADNLQAETLMETETPSTETTYRIYDMMAEPFGDWWVPRWECYMSDLILSEGENANTYLYIIDNDWVFDSSTQGIIYAPYRYNITAKNVPTLNVHNPEFLPLMGSGSVEGAQVDMNLYFQYMSNPWFTDVRSDWVGGTYYGTVPNWLYAYSQDGYVVQTMYTVTMNRAGALEWLGLPTTESDPVAWYDLIGDAYSESYGDWFSSEGNTRLDIAYGFCDNYYSEYTATRLSFDTASNEVTLEVLHFSWGYEVLMTRWLTEAGISPNHEPWYEDFNMDASYGDIYTDLSMDAVCQYSLHAVKAEGTENGAAWVWEPNHIDHCTDEDLPSYIVGPFDLPNEYEPYSDLSYLSKNAGDNLFGEQASYENTPYWFNLSENETLIFELPQGPVVGYLGEGVPYTEYNDLAAGDPSAFLDIGDDGVLSLGSYVSGGPDLMSMYDPLARTLTINGPVSFDNARHTEDGPLYHGAPWIEFNVVEPSTLLEGYVLDSDSSSPVPYTNLILYHEYPDGTYYHSEVSCDSYGFYSVAVPLCSVDVCVYGMDHAPLFTTLELNGASYYAMDFYLDLDLLSPICEVTSLNEGYVSTVRSTLIQGVATDDYLRHMSLEVLLRWDSLAPEVRYAAFDVSYVFLEPPEDAANVPYSVIGDTGTVDLVWDATTAIGGWLTHSTGSMYLPTEFSAGMFEFRGFYSDSTYTDAKVFLHFVEATGELYDAFFYDPYLGQVDPSTLTGTFEPAILTYAFDDVSGSPIATYEMWTPTGVMCQMPDLGFTFDPVLPSGEYRMFMNAYDFGYNHGSAFATVLVDNEGPVADAGEDMDVLVGDTVTLSASGSSDNEGIESCTWTIEDVNVTLVGEDVSYLFLYPGTYEILLTVTDVGGNVATDVVVVTVLQSVTVTEVWRLDGRATDSTVSWDCVPGSDGVLNIAIENHGLKVLVIGVYELDERTGSSVVWKEKVRLDDSGALVYCDPSPLLLAGHTYRVEYTPQGDVGAWAVVYAGLAAPAAPAKSDVSVEVVGMVPMLFAVPLCSRKLQ